MKNYILFLLLLIIAVSCNNKNDSVIAEVYQSKLYKSEIEELIPKGISVKDSTDFANQYINDWIMEQLILHEANKTLTMAEKNHEKEIEKFKNNLLINSYYQKITADSTQFQVSEEELIDFMKRYEQRYTIEREIIKFNYVKLSRQSNLIKPIRDILFDENRRITQKREIEKLCGDTIEYFIEDNTWLFLDDIQNEFPINIKNKEEILTNEKYIEAEDNEYHYLLVFLDYRTKRTVNETEEEIATARMMLQQQKKNEYINSKIETLYQSAKEKGIIIR